MKICEVTALLEQEGTWVRRNMKTRDHLLFGDDQQEVGRIGICWVASKGAILAAVNKKDQFHIHDENPFYQCSTQMHTAAIKAAEEKKRILQELESAFTAVMMCGTVLRNTALQINWLSGLDSNLKSVLYPLTIRRHPYLK